MREQVSQAGRPEGEQDTTGRPAANRPDPRSLLGLQRAVGNAAVQRLVRAGPGSDPKFAALKREVKGKQRRLSAHRPARTEASNAQGAAKPPADDKLAQGKVAQAGEMDAAKPGGFDKAAFIRAVNDAIAAQAPKNLDEADKFGDSGKADQVKSQVQGKVTAGKKASAGQIESATKAAPDTSRAVDKPVTPLTPDQAPATPGGPNPEQAVPDRAPPAATDFSAGPRQVNDQMAAAQVTEPQLANSNEPEFTDALKAKKEGDKHAQTAPPQLRASENRTLTAGKQHAAAAGATAMNVMALHRKTAGGQVHAGKQSTQAGDEARRAAATAKLQAVFDATRTEVEAILSGLDKKVDEQFTSLEGEARRAFTAEHKAKMDAYKDKRYSGWTGKLRWVKDKFAGLPEEANQIFIQARAGYTARMRQVISTIADTIATELGRAKARIAKGKADLAAEVNKLPADLQAMGRQAAAGFDAKFEELTEQVNSKGSELVQTLADKYSQALKSVDAEIEAEKEKNKGLIAKAVDAVKGVIDTILKLKDLLLGILAKAASAVMKILKDPIGFLGNLVHAVGAGLKEFIANIGEHLKKGLVSWLLGAAAQAGLQIPAKFDLKGILSLIGGLLGLTWSAIRGRVVSRGIPDQAITAAEKAVPEAEALQKEGLPGLWQRIQAKIGNLKDMIMGKLAAFLIPTVLIAGITWLVSLLTPASAFVKACKAIIDIITFIVERGAQLAAFVNAVLDAVIAIAGGGAGGVPGLIVNALAASIPVLIGFLAALLGVGGLAEKVKKVFQTISKPVMKVVDWVVDKIVTLARKFWNKLKNKFGKDKKDTGKGDQGGPVTAPRQLAEPAELTVDTVNPALAADLAKASSGEVIHRGAGGSPEQVTKTLLAEHSDARFDRSSGTLRLPAVSGVSQAGSLTALGAAIGQKTGVSQVIVEKKSDEVELWASINPRVRVAKIKGLATDEAVLRIAVVQTGIVQFLKNMAAGASMNVTQGAVSGTIDMAGFERAWAKQSNVDWLKQQFRNAMPGRHEWIPSNYLMEVTKRARDFAQEGPKWIDLQHELRSETFRIVFAPAMSPPEVVRDKVAGDTAERSYSVPNGHVGAVYYKGKERTVGTGDFHDSLRRAFENKVLVKDAAQAALAVARRWTWNGTPMSPDIHPECRDKNGTQVTAANQVAHVQAIEGHFTPFV